MLICFSLFFSAFLRSFFYRWTAHPSYILTLCWLEDICVSDCSNSSSPYLCSLLAYLTLSFLLILTSFFLAFRSFDSTFLLTQSHTQAFALQSYSCSPPSIRLSLASIGPLLPFSTLLHTIVLFPIFLYPSR